MRNSYERGSLEGTDELQEQARLRREALLAQLAASAPSAPTAPASGPSSGGRSSLPIPSRSGQADVPGSDGSGGIGGFPSGGASTRSTPTLASTVASTVAPDPLQPETANASPPPVGTERYAPAPPPAPGAVVNGRRTTVINGQEYTFVQGRGWIPSTELAQNPGLGASPYGADEQGRPTVGGPGTGPPPIGTTNTPPATPAAPTTPPAGGGAVPTSLGRYGGPGSMEGYGHSGKRGMDSYSAEEWASPQGQVRLVLSHINPVGSTPESVQQALRDAGLVFTTRGSGDSLEYDFEGDNSGWVDIKHNKNNPDGPWSWIEKGYGDGDAAGAAGGGGLVSGIADSQFFNDPMGLLVSQINGMEGNDFLMALLKQLTQGQQPKTPTTGA